MMSDFLGISYGDSPVVKVVDSPKYENYVLPFKHSELYYCPIQGYDLLTKGTTSTRNVYNLKLSSKEMLSSYEAGYTIGVLPSNDPQLVDQLIIRLGLEEVCDKVYELKIIRDAKKKNTCLPKHIPACGTIRGTFLHYIDIGAVPKKIFLKALLPFVDDQKEHDALAFVCSPSGSEEYKKLITSYTDRTLISILNRFSSCHPPVEKLFEYLPPLLPRPYSISNSPLTKDYLSFTFSVDTFENNRKGICTSWLEKAIQKFQETSSALIPIYLRIPSDFKLPEDNSDPIIMIATGTGIAPFRGFLEHRHLQIDDIPFGPSLLFYGCRSSEDCLFKKDLENYLESGALSELFICYSRKSEKCYVQHKIEEKWMQLNSLILGGEAKIYVCGNYSKVLPQVRNALLKVLILGGLTDESAELYLKEMKETHRYLEDSWN